MQWRRGPELTPFNNISINAGSHIACYRNYVPTMCERSLVLSFMIRSWWDLDSPGDRNNPLATFRVVLGPETIKYKTELTAPLFGHPDTSDNNNSRAELPRPQFWLSPRGHLGSSRALGTSGNPSHLRTKASTSPPVW